MKNIALALLSLACLAFPVRAAEMMGAMPGATGERFYGKITGIDHNKQSVTVHNAKQNTDARFNWSDQTTIISDRKPIPATELKVGQSLVITYVTVNDLNHAKHINVRHPFKKSQQ